MTQPFAPHWHFIEITDIERIKNSLSEAIERISRAVDDKADNDFWMGVQMNSMEDVWGNDDDQLFDLLG